MNPKVTAAAHPNLAFVKYWGKADAKLNIPVNSSISVNLSGATTTTSVTFSADQDTDVVMINGHIATPKTYNKVVCHLDRIRHLAGIDERAIVESSNDFPASAGIASSASAFASLSLAASEAAGLNLDERQLSILARKGSGSACRSIPDGFVEWSSGTGDSDSYAHQIAPPDHWDIKITTVILDERPKDISSSEGHQTAKTSPFYQARLDTLPRILKTVRQGLLTRDFRSFGQAVEREAVSMHVVAMTTHPEGRDWQSGVYYWQPATLYLIQAVQEWRHQGLEVYFTIDAGPNVHLLCEGEYQADLELELKQALHEFEGKYLVSVPARGAWIVKEQER
jgi:diphosphomevalonate decarboxylase